jgi:hypothetical protein
VVVLDVASGPPEWGLGLSLCLCWVAVLAVWEGAGSGFGIRGGREYSPSVSRYVRIGFSVCYGMGRVRVFHV